MFGFCQDLTFSLYGTFASIDDGSKLNSKNLIIEVKEKTAENAINVYIISFGERVESSAKVIWS